MTDIKKLKERIAGLEDYGVESRLRRIKSPLSKEVPFGKEDRKLEQIREDSLDRSTEEGLATYKGTKVRPTKPKQSDRRRIISAKQKIRQLQSKTNELKIAKDHAHSIVFRGHKLGVFRSASLENQSGKFAKYWLLNAKQTNGNGWGIAAHTAKENMKKFIGRPLVITAQSWHGSSMYGDSYEHPYLPTNDMNQIFAHQEMFRVGNIVDVYEDKHGDWYASVEMLPKFAMKNLPPFCSPAIYQLDASEHEGNISKWEALHLAALTENPAYGARIALLKGTCIGTANSCTVQFKGAQLNAIIRKDKLQKRASDFYDSLLPEDDDIAQSNKIHFNPGERERERKIESYILRSPNKKGRRVNQNQYRKYGDQEANANKDYTRNDKKINPSIYPAGHKMTTYLKRRLASLEKEKKKKIEDIDNYDEMRDRREYTVGDTGMRRTGQIVCPKKLKERIASIFDEIEANPGMSIKDTKQVFNDGSGTEEDVALTYGKKTLKEKRLKLKKRIASLGEQNMTYQNSKKVKILKKKHPEVRKAQNSVEDILRGMGRSVDATHHQSSFLSTKGDFIGGGDIHDIQVRNILDPTGAYGETVTHNFLKKHGLARVQNFPINRAGERKVSVGIHSKINPTQLKSIQDLEKGGRIVGFAVGPMGKEITGEGSRDLIKALREHKFL